MKNNPLQLDSQASSFLKVNESFPHEKMFKVLEQSLDLICVLNRGDFVMVSTSCERILGYTREELIGRCCGDFIVEEDIPDSMIIAGEIETGERITDFVNRYKRKDGSIIWLMWSASYDPHDGLMYCIGRDITELKKAQDEVAKMNERFYYASKATSDVIWDWDLGSNLLTWGENYETIFGYRQNDDKSHISQWYIRIHPEDCERVVNGINAAIRGSVTNWTDSYRYRNADENYCWVDDRGIIIRNESGKAIRMIGSMNDITRRKKTEEMLQQSEQRFRSLVQESSDMIAILNADGDYTYVSPSVEKVLGFKPEYFQGKNAFQFIHPDDIERSVLALKSISGKSSLQLEPFRFQNNKGEWRWIETKLTNQTDNEIIRGIVANSRDITDKKEYEDKLRFKAILARETINAVVITNMDGNITWVNDAFLKNYGYMMEEVLGRNTLQLLSGARTKKEKIKLILSLREAGKVVDMEMVYYTKSGSPRIIALQMQPILNERGEATSYFAIHHDLTEKRKLQYKLQREVRERQRIITRAVLDAQEKYRENIARELHDNVNQILTTVKLYLEICKSDPAGCGELLASSIDLVNRSTEEIREISHSLSSFSVKELTLKDALLDLVDSVNLTRKCMIQVITEGYQENEIHQDLKLAIYRIIQEQLNNTLKHARATEIEIRIGLIQNTIQLQITDNGVGFDTSKSRNGIGLNNIESRVFAYSGKMEIISSVGKGCKLIIEFPVEGSSVGHKRIAKNG